MADGSYATPMRSLGTEIDRRVTGIVADAAAGALDDVIAALADSIAAGGVIQAFGTGHSEAFAMEIAGRAGGLIPTNRLALKDLALYGDLDPDVLDGSELERDPGVAARLLALYPIQPADAFVIASNSGVNGSIVGVALAAKERGHTVVAVTSAEHTAGVEPKHPSGQRLADVADFVIDNRAPYGDTTVALDAGIKVGAVSSITAAVIAQLLTLGIATRLAATGETPPVYISANIPEGDQHNGTLEQRYGNRIKRGA